MTISFEHSRGESDLDRAKTREKTGAALAFGPGRGPALRTPSTLYLIAGVALGLGAPVGFLILRLVLSGVNAEPDWLWGELRQNALAYLYMALSTPLVFGIFGRAIGQREERLRVASAEVERLREEFAAVVAHDLRNPLHAIRMELELLLQGAGEQVVVPAAALQRLRRGGERLTQMTNDLLDASRIEASRLTLVREGVSLPDAIAALLERIRTTLGNHPVEVRFEGPVPLVSADPMRLDQILTNLLENAAKYSAGGRPIVVRARPSHGGAIVSIEDEGQGIRSDELPYLFDRFYQAKRARAKKTGLGLGLYITKGLVDAHGGRIDVESIPGRGSRFSVWLPATTR